MTERLDLSRSFGLFRPEQARSRVVIIGAGAVGNNTAQLLARMGVTDITVYDFDFVESVNCGPQGYRLADVRNPPRPKVEACAEIAREFTGIEIDARHERYVDQPLEGIVVTAVDDIEVRKAIWQQVNLYGSHVNNVDLYIDPRMGGLSGNLRTVRPNDPDDIRDYETSLFPKGKAAPVPCTERAISYNAAGLAALICGAIRGWWVSGMRKPYIIADYGELNFHVVDAKQQQQ